MVRWLLLFLLSLSLLTAKTSIDTQIKQTNAKLKNYDKRYRNAHSKLSKSAKKILREQKRLLQLDQKLTQLSSEYEAQKSAYSDAQEALSKLQTQKELTQKEREETQAELLRLLTKQLTLRIILSKRNYSDAQALMRQEIFASISRLTKDELHGVKQNISKILDHENFISDEIAKRSETINKIDDKRQMIVRLKEKQQKRIKALDVKRESYKKELEKSLNTKDNLRAMLEKLQIIKVDEEKRAQRLAEKRKAEEARRRAQKSKSTNIDKIKVVKHGDSYEKVKTIRYRGKKTIAPINGYEVVKKFGPYNDPIYNIKIFNDSILLKPQEKNAIVRAVLNGKVMISNNNSLLGNFIIIQHDQGLHTVYAHLDKVAPTVKQGQRIRQGATIGRVNNELMFQVTQQNSYIDPQQMIQ